MTTLVILSDTHGNRRDIDALDTVIAECDMIVHLGDTSQDGNYIRGKYPDKTRLINGNCDLVKLGEDEIILDIEGVKIFACHGHGYSVKSGNIKLTARAKELGCNVALYGHTHRAEEVSIDGVLVVNPGTLSRYSEKSYCYMVINGDKAVAKIVYTDARNQ